MNEQARTPYREAGLDREAVARIIDPIAFHSSEGLISYCRKQGDDEAAVRTYVERTYGPEIAEAYRKADAILALTSPTSEDAGAIPGPGVRAMNLARCLAQAEFRSDLDRCIDEAKAIMSGGPLQLAALSNTQPQAPSEESDIVARLIDVAALVEGDDFATIQEAIVLLSDRYQRGASDAFAAVRSTGAHLAAGIAERRFATDTQQVAGGTSSPPEVVES